MPGSKGSWRQARPRSSCPFLGGSSEAPYHWYYWLSLKSLDFPALSTSWEPLWLNLLHLPAKTLNTDAWWALFPQALLYDLNCLSDLCQPWLGYRFLCLAKFSTTFLSKSLSPQMQAQSKPKWRRETLKQLLSVSILLVYSFLRKQEIGEMSFLLRLETGKLQGRRALTSLLQWSHSLPFVSYLCLNYILNWVITHNQTLPISISSSHSLTASTCLHICSLLALVAKLQKSFNRLGSSSHRFDLLFTVLHLPKSLLQLSPTLNFKSIIIITSLHSSSTSLLLSHLVKTQLWLNSTSYLLWAYTCTDEYSWLEKNTCWFTSLKFE